MAKIHLTTFIAAPVERVFDLSRSIRLHMISTAASNEKAIAGVLDGLISENETVTWQAKHLFKEREFTSRITMMKRHSQFTDEMIQGDFKYFSHEHFFKTIDNGSFMIDYVNYESPYGVIGKLMNKLYLNNYLTRLLIKRNEVIKEYAETEKWKTILF